MCVCVCAARTALCRQPPTNTKQQSKHHSFSPSPKTPGQNGNISDVTWCIFGITSNELLSCMLCLSCVSPLQSSVRDIMLHYCFGVAVIFTQTSHHYLSSGIATTGPSNWPHNHCQSNCHGNIKTKQKKQHISHQHRRVAALMLMSRQNVLE